MNRRASLPRRPRSPRVKCRFNLSDPTERDALRWIQCFHAPSSIYRLLDSRRGKWADGKRVVLLLTHAQPQRQGAKPEWLVISYNIDEIHIVLPSYETRTAADMAFKAAASKFTPPVGCPERRGPT